MTTYYRCANCQAILVGEQTACVVHPEAAKTKLGIQTALGMDIDWGEYEREVEAERAEDEGILNDLDEQHIDRSMGG